MNPRLASLQLFYDNDFVASIPLNRASVRIGRSRGSDLRLIDPSVSRNHLKIALSDKGAVTLEDLSSTNGTFLNGRRIVTAQLAESDVIAVGRCTLVFRAVDPKSFDGGKRSFWRRWIGKKKPMEVSRAYGTYVLSSADFITEFDAVSYAIVRDQLNADEIPRTAQSHLKRISRVRVLAGADPKAGTEVTRFSVSKNIFVGTPSELSPKKEEPQVVLPQPKVKLRKWRVPWKTIEFVTIPLLLVVLGIVTGKYFLVLQIDTEFKKAEKSWDEKLTRAGETYRLVLRKTAPEPTLESSPLSVEEVWRQIDRRSDLRNSLLFEILDEILASADLNWSLEEALKNLSRLRSVTTRLPSVKHLRVVLSTETLPSPGSGVLSKRLIFLSDRETPVGLTEAYQAYKTKLSDSLGIVAGCASVRKSALPGNVVASFTVNADGKVTSIFVNESRSSREQALWGCIKNSLAEARFDPPPAGSLSIVYTFKFAGPARVEF